MQKKTSIPTITKFRPEMNFQKNLIKDIRFNFNYSLGTHECLLSGSVGSGKSLIMAHVGVTHCWLYSGARFLLGRRSMPDLRSTLWAVVIAHIGNDLVYGLDYSYNQRTGIIVYKNGSEMICRSWADGRYQKVRSLDLSGAAIEEAVENDKGNQNETIEMEYYKEINTRIGRLPHVLENILLIGTNPGPPSSPIYKRFMEEESPTRHVYYSLTEENPYLSDSYVNKLKRDLDPKLARRMLYGEWIEITQDVVYYAYDKRYNFINKTYSVDPQYPIFLTWDFNIGDGKPLSVAAFQFIGDCMHIFNEAVVEGMRTEESCEELAGKGILEHNCEYIITGDATGKARDTRNKSTDYSIIKKWFANARRRDKKPINFSTNVPKSNGPIRKRHNLVNSYCLNEMGARRLKVYAEAPTADKGLRLTQLRKGGSYIEDDSLSAQHITTAIGYGLAVALRRRESKPQGTVLL